MNSHTLSFLAAVLGDEATSALKKAAERSEALSTVIGSRTVMGWMGFASRYGYEGEIPGLPGSYLRLGKSEAGLEGEIRMGKNVHVFSEADVALAAAGVCAAIGTEVPASEDVRDGELARLGQNIDLLIATRAINKAEEEGEHDECYNCGVKLPADGICTNCKEVEEESKRVQEREKRGLDKAGFTAPGGAAQQNKPSGAAGGGFAPPTPATPKRTRKPGKFGAKLTQSQATSKCSVCEEPQFRGDRFVGCYCLRDLAKSASAEAVEGGYRLTFDEPWSKSDIALLMDIVNGESDAE